MRRYFYCLCIMLLCLTGCEKEETAVICESVEQEEIDLKEKLPVKEEEKSEICVYVCGQVKNPGVYELPADMRIADAIEAAGGMTEQAAQTYLNQAAFLEDGQKVYVPDQEEAEEKLQLSTEQRKVNLNTAGISELTTLSGVGESKAQAIIRYREENGGFCSIDEIMKIEGIKEGVFQKIKDHIVVE